MKDKVRFRRSWYEWIKRDNPDDIDFKNRFEAIVWYLLDGIETPFFTEEMRKMVDAGANQNGRRTADYKKWRMAVLERDGFRCVCCGQIGGTLHAHHIKPYANYPELRCEINNGITLCEECHKEAHRKKK